MTYDMYFICEEKRAADFKVFLVVLPSMTFIMHLLGTETKLFMVEA